MNDDPLESDPTLAKILREAERLTDQRLADHPCRGGLGFCHLFWAVKSEILRDHYGISWKSPADQEPPPFLL